MDKNQSEDIDSDSESFEICDPVVNSITDSMSIVTIPEPIPRTLINSSPTVPTNSFVTNSFNNETNSDTRRVDSFDGLPNYAEIQEQEFQMSQKMSNIATEEQNQSLQKLADNLIRIESNVKNCSNNLEDILSANLEIHLKELRNENENLKTELEKNNQFMKQQLKNLHEWQTKNQEVMEDHKRALNYSKELSVENQSLKEENERLKQKVTEMEVKASLVEELTAEVDSLRNRCHQMANYEKLDVTSELQTHELTARLVDSQRAIDALTSEINVLKIHLTEASTKLESVPAMESQLYIFERDFKIEEMAKMAALKEVSELEDEIEKLKLKNCQLEERLDKGEPVVNLQKDELPRTKPYTCPKCWRSFERFQTIQNHFEGCLEEDGLFT